MIYFYVNTQSENLTYISQDVYNNYNIIINGITIKKNLTLNDAIKTRQILCGRESCLLVDLMFDTTIISPAIYLYLPGLISYQEFQIIRKKNLKEADILIKYDLIKDNNDLDFLEVLNIFKEDKDKEAENRVFSLHDILNDEKVKEKVQAIIDSLKPPLDNKPITS